MGAHWVDLLSPEFHGVKFTNTYIWGSYSGKFIFWEPMLTLAYLQSQPNDLIPLRQPAKYQKDGWYAQKYQVSYSLFPNLNTGEYTVALKNLKHYTAIER
jgi:hypothetical protein